MRKINIFDMSVQLLVKFQILKSSESSPLTLASLTLLSNLIKSVSHSKIVHFFQ